MALHNSPIVQTNNPSRQSNNYLIEAVFLLVVIILGSWFILRPKIASVTETKQQLVKIENEYQRVEDDKKALNKLIDDLKESGQEIALVDEALPLNSRITRLYVLLEKIAEDSGMNIASINREEGEARIAAGNKPVLDAPFSANRDLVTDTMTVSLTGSLEQFRGYLRLLETSPRLIDVESINLAAQESTVLYRVKINAYSYAP